MSTNDTIAKNLGFTKVSTNHYERNGVHVSKMLTNMWSVFTAEKTILNVQNLNQALAAAK